MILVEEQCWVFFLNADHVSHEHIAITKIAKNIPAAASIVDANLTPSLRTSRIHDT